MTEILTFPSTFVDNRDTIFYNVVDNFIPYEWRNLTNNYGKRLSITARQLLSLIVSRLQFDNKRDKQVEELQEGYLFFQQKLGVGQRRVRQCLLELKDSGLIDFYSTTLIIRNMRCPHIQCIKLLKNFVSSRKTNYHSNQQEFLKQTETNHNSIGQNIQPNPQKISGQPEKNCTSTEKIEKNFFPLNIIDNNIFISRYGKKKFLKKIVDKVWKRVNQRKSKVYNRKQR
ncbi:hypothetical protein [Candidatus Tisiphia endosymbiont of Nemotelus uliginosus]|uniref:hypothetical protein n=1 Tax=Candidatus Tisiphia endosymbiont of Nemotelus uliginosus TaxID=3077926 RepID=UPI0035C8CEDD